ncbi:hypothetical protein SFIMM107S_07435 [Streptomyces griseus]
MPGEVPGAAAVSSPWSSSSRQEPGDGKVSRILVPVFLESEEDPGDMMVPFSYRPLVVILQGLRAHGDRVIQHLPGGECRVLGGCIRRCSRRCAGGGADTPAGQCR